MLAVVELEAEDEEELAEKDRKGGFGDGLAPVRFLSHLGETRREGERSGREGERRSGREGERSVSVSVRVRVSVRTALLPQCLSASVSP